MIVKKEVSSGKITIDLTGPEGNAYFLLNAAKRLCAQLAIDSAPVIKQMTAGNYEHLVATFDSHFGDFVILER